jgi:diguanylate cyclase (GGDEF)-like protein/PAS domain S-box-containing protein
VPDDADELEALMQFLYMAPVGLAQMSLSGEIAMINPLSAQLLMPLSHRGDLSNLFTALESVAPDLRSLVDGFRDPSGTVCDAQRLQVDAGVRGKRPARVLSLTLLKLDETRLMAVLSDVSMQVERERLLKQNEAWFAAILTGVQDYAFVSLDGEGHIDEWNESIARVTGFGAGQVIGQPFSLFYPPDATTPDRLLDRLREADDSGWSLDDGWRTKADGTRFWGSAMIAPLAPRNDPSGLPRAETDARPSERAYCLILRDITDKREASEAQRRATSCDHLTGIANRRAFFEAAELEIERRKRSPRPLSLIAFDVDHFKRVNDTYGHPAGDAVLRRLATVLASTFRQVDVVARIGGEEFAVLLPSTGLEAAVLVAERFRRAVEAEPIEVDGIRIACTVSGGVATMDDGSSALDLLMKRADRALYKAKSGGRNRIERALEA